MGSPLPSGLLARHDRKFVMRYDYQAAILYTFGSWRFIPLWIGDGSTVEVSSGGKLYSVVLRL